jgi:hypothetical protein
MRRWWWREPENSNGRDYDEGRLRLRACRRREWTRRRPTAFPAQRGVRPRGIAASRVAASRIDRRQVILLVCGAVACASGRFVLDASIRQRLVVTRRAAERKQRQSQERGQA